MKAKIYLLKITQGNGLERNRFKNTTQTYCINWFPVQSESINTLKNNKKNTIDDDVLCGICTEIMTSAVLLPCCGGAACYICAREYLIENGNVCPLCSEANQLPEDVVPAVNIRIKIAEFKEQVLIIVLALTVRIKVSEQIIVPAL